MNILRVLGVIAAGLCGIGAAAGVGRQPEAEKLPAAESVSFDEKTPPMLQVKRIKSGHILVRPTINGHDAGWFIFDTGAGICVVSTPVVEGLELTAAGEVEAKGVGGSKAAKLYTATLRLGPATFSRHTLMETDLSFLEPLVGEKICGVIGYGVLSKCVAEIDLSAPSIGLFKPEGYGLARGAWTPMDVGDRVPTVPGAFEGHAGRFRLDLGATGSVTFHQPAVVKYDLLKDRTVKDCKMGGVGGFVAGKRGTIGSLELGGITFKDVDADFALEAKGTFAEASKDANIGTDILRKFLVVTDYPHERIALVSKADSLPPPAAK